MLTAKQAKPPSKLHCQSEEFMEKIVIVCVDDQREVLDAVVRDLQPLLSFCTIEECESADECLDLLDDLDDEGQYIGLVISDHVMPGKSGVQMLTEIAQNQRFNKIKKILLTGLASHQDTIEAINNAGVDNYLEKAWDPAKLLQSAKSLLTHYVIDAGIDYQSILSELDIEVIYQRTSG